MFDLFLVLQELPIDPPPVDSVTSILRWLIGVAAVVISGLAGLYIRNQHTQLSDWKERALANEDRLNKQSQDVYELLQHSADVMEGFLDEAKQARATTDAWRNEVVVKLEAMRRDFNEELRNLKHPAS